MNKPLIFLLTIVLSAAMVQARTNPRQLVREGNKAYDKESYTEAEVAYRKALEDEKKPIQATYNLGNSLYRQQKAQDAFDSYQAAAAAATSPEQKAAAYHNMGNVLMQGEDYANAVKAYQLSLLENPADNETRYNLALAQALLKQQQQQQQQNQDQNQNQDKQDKQDEQQQQQQQEQDQPQDQQNQDKSSQENQPEDAEEQLSKEQAQQLLEALMQDEQEVQDKVKQLQMQQGKRRKTEKDW